MEYTCLGNGMPNNLALDNGGTLDGLEGVPAGTNLTLDGGTNLVIDDPTVSLGNETLNDGLTLSFGGQNQSVTVGDVTLNDASTLSFAGQDQSISLGDVPLNDGSTLSFTGQNQSVSLGAVTLNEGSTLNLGGQAVTAGVVTLNDGWITAGSLCAESYSLINGEIDADMTGGPATLTGNGMVYLTGINTYTGGTTVGATAADAGTLEAQTTAALPGYDSYGVVSVGSNATLAVAVGGSGDWQSADIDALLANALFSGGASLGIDTTDGNFVYGSNIADTAGGPLGLVVLGNNVLTLTGANSYTGGTSLQGGTLEAQTPGSLPGHDGSPSFGVLSVGSGTTLAVAVGATGDWQSGDIDSLLANAVFCSGAALGIDTTDGNFLYGSNIADTTRGPLGLVKLGSNELTLSGDNTYSGGTAVYGGTLTVQNYSLPTGGGIYVAGGATLHYETTAGNISQLPTTFTGGGTLLVDGGNSLIFGGTGGDVDVSFDPGGLIDVEAGTLLGSADGEGQWADNCASLNIAAGATFDAGDGDVNIDALTGGGTFQGGCEAGLVTATIGVAGGSGSFSGVIQDNGSGSLALVKTGAGTQTLSGINTYSGGTTVGATIQDTGTLEAQRPGSLPGYDSPGVISVGSTATLAVAVGGADDWQSGEIDNLLANAQFSGGAALGIDTTDGNFIYGSNIGDTAGGPLTLVKLGENMLTLTGANSYTGGTYLAGGTLKAQTTGSLPGYDGSSSFGVVSVRGGTTLVVAVGITGNWQSGDIDTLLSNVAFNDGAVLGIDTSDGDFVYDSNITDTDGGSLGLVKLGDNMLTLGGANSYSGGTDVEPGTLQVGSSTALGTGNLTVNGGTLDLNGTSITLPEFSGTGGTITNNADNSPATLTVNDTNGDTMNFAGVLQDGQSPLGLALFGNSTLTLGGADSVSGGVVIGAGSELDVSGTLNVDTSLTNNGTLVVEAGGSLYNAGTLDSNGAMTNSGYLENDATLNIAGTFGGTFVDDGVLGFHAATNQIYSGNISGTGSVVVYGSAELTGENSYTGSTTIYGTLAVNYVALDGTSAILLDGGTLQAITGSTSITQSITLDAASTIDVNSGCILTAAGGITARRP